MQTRSQKKRAQSSYRRHRRSSHCQKKGVLLAKILQDANTLVENVNIAENLEILMLKHLEINNVGVLL